MTRHIELIDFHCHHVPGEIALNPLPAGHGSVWQTIRDKLTSREALLESIESGDVDARVVNVPPEQFTAPGAHPPQALIERINDRIAELVAAHPGRLLGLATIDAFSGDAGAREVERAHRTLSLNGIYIESASGDDLLDAPQARPTLEAAACRGLPVFVHPINPQQLTARLARYGRPGSQLARGTVSSATLIALLESGTFDALPDLRLVVTTLAIGGVLLSAALSSRRAIRDDADALLRRHVYIDTMGFDASLIRVCAALLGADHVLLGSDWPIDHAPLRARAETALRDSGLTDDQQRLIASGNVRRLLRTG